MKGRVKKTLIFLCTMVMLCVVSLAVVGCGGCKKKKQCKHNWDEGTVTVEATCTTRGEIVYECKKCSETKSVVVSPSHTFVDTVTAATCTTDGYTTHTCERCGEVRIDTHVTATGHTYTKTSTQATCENDGYDVYTCACGDSYRDITERAHGHSVNNADWTVVEDVEGRECTHIITEEATCSTCSEKVTKEYEVVRHTYEVSSLTEATCVSTGSKTYTCSEDGCDASYSETIAINASAHAWDGGTEDNGVIVYACTHGNCTHTKREIDLSAAGSTATISTEALSQDVGLQMENATMQMDETLIGKLSSSNVQLTAEKFDKTDDTVATAVNNMSAADKERLGDKPIFNFGLTANGDNVDFDGGKMKVSVPYVLGSNEDPDTIAIWYIGADGNVSLYPATYANGFATFEAEHFSFYTVVRMTPAERCAKYGHNWSTETTAASCTEDGYTLKVCKACHKSERVDFVAATGHDYQSRVTAPTCATAGYTTYTCSHCDDSYVSARTAALNHEYEETVVAPACTQDGYTIRICKHCKKSIVDSFVDKLGHEYKDGACSVCGAADPNAVSSSHNFYINLLNSVGKNGEQTYFEIKDINVKVEMPGALVGYESAQSMLTEMKIDSMKFSFTVKDGKVEGKGEMSAQNKTTITYSKNNVKIEESIATMKYVIKDGKVYLYQELREGDEEDTMYSYQDLSNEIMEESVQKIIDQLLPILDTNVSSIVAKMLEQSNSPTESAIKSVVEYFFVRTETADGYTFTFDFDKIADVYETLTTKTIGEIFDGVFGNGKYDSTVNWLKSSTGKTVSTLVGELTREALRSGIDLNDVYKMVDEILVVVMPAQAGEQQLTVNSLLSLYGGKTIVDFINGDNTGEGAITAEALSTEIEDYAARFKTMTVMDLFSVIGGGSNGPSHGETVRPMANEIVANDPVLAFLKEILEGFDKTFVGFTTDKAGSIQNCSINLDIENFVCDLSTLFGQGQQAAEESSMNVKVNAKGGMSLVFGKTLTTEYNDLIEKVNSFRTILSFKDGETISGRYNSDYVVKVKDGVSYIATKNVQDYVNISNFDKSFTPVQETVNGVACTKIRYCNGFGNYGSRTHIIDNGDSFYVSNDCTGWVQFDVNTKEYFDSTYYYVWFDENQKVIKSEVDWETTLAQSTEEDGYFDFYYHAETKTYTRNEIHKWKIIDYKDSTCTEEGYRVEICTVCSQERRWTIGKESHEIEMTYELKEGSTSCTDGAYQIATCKVCKQEVDKEEITWHGMNRYKESLSGATCQNLAFYYAQCPCKENVQFGYYEDSSHSDCEVVDGDCLFDEIVSDYQQECTFEGVNVFEYRYHVYRCSVTDCGYTYVKESWETYKDCKRTDHYRFYLGCAWDGDEVVTKNATKKEFTSVKDSHNENKTKVAADTAMQLTHVYEYVCSDCHNVIRKVGYAYDKFGREIRYWNYFERCGSIYEYDENCDYYEYAMNSDGSKGEQSGGGRRHTDGYYYGVAFYQSCSQYGVEYRHCDACGLDESRQTATPRGHYFVANDKGGYVCEYCHLESANNATGNFYLEDLLYNQGYGNGYAFAAGFYNRGNVIGQMHIVANYGLDSEVVLDDLVKYTVSYYKENGNSVIDYACGNVVVDMETLGEWAEEYVTKNGGTIVSFSIVFEYADPNSGNYDYETGVYEGTFLEEAITWNAES